MNAKTQQQPDGPCAAVLLAGGLGIFALGLLCILGELSGTVRKWLNLYNPVGPLSGNTIWAVVSFATSAAVLGAILRRKDFNLKTAFAIAVPLTFLGLLLTFPPVFEAR